MQCCQRKLFEAAKKKKKVYKTEMPVKLMTEDLVIILPEAKSYRTSLFTTDMPITVLS